MVRRILNRIIYRLRLFPLKLKRALSGLIDRLGLTYPLKYGIMMLRKHLGLDVPAHLSEEDTLFQLYCIMRRSKRALAEMDRLSGHGPRVLFPHMRGSPYGLAFETFVAQRLRFDGAQPVFMACEDLPLCDNRYIDTPNNPGICKYCLERNRSYVAQMGLPSYKLTDLVGRASYNAAYEATQSLDLDQCFQFHYRNVPIGELCEVSVTHYLCRDVQECDSSEALQVWRDFLTGAIVLVDAYEEAFSRFQPDVLFVWNGRLFWNSIALWMAQRRGIKVASYETSWLKWDPGKEWIFRRDIAAADLDLHRPWCVWRDVELTEEEDVRLDEVMKKRMYDPLIYPNPVEDRAIIRNELGLADSKPVVAMFPNLTWDSTVVGKRTIFRSVVEFVKETVGFADRKKDFSLVIRVHPAEKLNLGGRKSREHVVDSLCRELSCLPDNVRIVPPNSQLSSYTLLDLANVVLVYSGTLGLEASIRGKCPVIICGKAHYADKGFGYYPQSREDYFKLLANLDRLSPPSELEISLARRYAYLYWSRTVIPLQFFVRDEQGRITRFTVQSLEDLRPGCNPYLDLVADGIMGRGEFVLPREVS